MGQIVLGAAGAVAGTFLGVGPGVGWAAGSMLGGMIFNRQKAQRVSQPMIDLKVVGTEYGQPIPWLRGRCRLAGQLWWNTDRRPIRTVTRSGGKGGGPPEQETETITYEMDALYGLTSNKIVGIARIWDNGELIWTMSSDSDEGSVSESSTTAKWRRITIYTGADDQLPDPTYEAAMTAQGRTPIAYRQRGTVFIEGLQLGASGAIPNLTFEVVVDGEIESGVNYDPPAGFSELSPISWDSGDKDEDIVLSNDNLTATKATSAYANVRSTIKNLTAGKVYCEFQLGGDVSDILVGLWNPGDDITLPWTDPDQIFALCATGDYRVAGGPVTHGTTPSFNPNDVVMMAVDFDAGYAWFGINGVWNEAADPASGLDPHIEGLDNGMDWAICFRTDNHTETPRASVTAFISTNTITAICPTVADVQASICERAGMSSDQYDVSDLASISRNVCSLPWSQVSSAREPSELLMSMYYYEATVSDKIYFRVRGRTPAATIEYEELGAVLDGKDPGEPLALKLHNDIELAAQIALTYSNLSNDYQDDTQPSDRLVSAIATSVRQMGVSIGMVPAEAKAVANTILMDHAMALVGTTIDVLGDHVALQPTDVVLVQGPNEETLRLRLVKLRDAYPWLSFECTLDDAAVLSDIGITSLDYESSTSVSGPADTLMELLDIPILRDADNDAGLYVAVKPDGLKWPGAAIFDSTDDVNFARALTLSERAVIGTTVTALGDWTGSRVIDETNRVRINTGLGELTSSTRDEVLNSTVNALLVGDEILQFITATFIEVNADGENIYEVYRLLRGSRGTEAAMTGHAIGERVVLLRPAGLRRLEMDNADIGVQRYYKPVTFGRTPASVDSEEFTNTAVGLKPFAPMDLRAARDASGDVTFTAQRRTRLSVRMIGTAGINVPLGESYELYKWYIYSPTTPFGRVRTLTSSTPSVVYTTAQQSADGYSINDPIEVGVVQVSDTVGDGFELKETV